MTAELESKRCRRCGEPLAGAELSGNCPRCLATLLLSPESPAPIESSPMPVLRRLGDYELLEEVARGGMGVVFRARQVTLDRIVAVKVLRDAWLATPVQVKRFQAEAANAAKLKHPNIVAVHEVGEQGGQHYFAMDLIKGTNLAEATREGPLPPRRAAELVGKVAEAVQHAHQQGVLHRDVKPSNVLLDTQGEPQVTDFGLARPMDEESSLTLTGQVLGTPGYIAPEQAKGGATVGPAADVYGLGALLFHLLTGRAPFVGASAAETLTQVLQQEPLSPRLLNPAVPVDLAAVCLKCLGKRPRERYGSAGELAADLGRFLGNETTHARPAGAVKRALRWCRRKPALAALVVLVFGVVVVGGMALALWAQQTGKHAAQQRQAATILASLLQGLGPQIAMARNSTETQRLLVDATERITHEFSDQPDTKANLLVTVGDTWEAIGEFARAEALFRQALLVRERFQGRENLITVEIIERIGANQRKNGQLELSEATLRVSLALKRKLGAPPASEIEALHQLGVTLSQRRNFVEAEGLLREALRGRQSAPAQSRALTAATEYALGHVLCNTARVEEAESLLQSALDLQRHTFGDLHPEVARTLRELAWIRSYQKRWSEAEALLAEALRVQQALLGAHHGETLSTEWHLARIAREQGRLVEAENAFKELLPRMELTRGRNHFMTMLLRASLARLEEYQGEDAAAFTNWLHLLAADFEPEPVIRGLEGLLASQTFTPLFCPTPKSPLIWRFTTNAPPEGWEKPGFRDGDWPQAPAPFGSSDTAARTHWESSQLCLRTEFTCSPQTRQIIIRARHDDGISVWLNGSLVATNSLWSFGSYWLYPISDSALHSLNATNTLAVEVVNHDEGAHANVELYLVKDDIKAPLRQLVKELSIRIQRQPDDVGWLRARGRVRLAIGEGKEAATDFRTSLLILDRGGDTNALPAAQLEALNGEAELLAARRNDVNVNAPEAMASVGRAVGLLRESRTKLAHITSTNDWQYADVCGLLGAALTMQAKLQPQKATGLMEADALLHFSWAVIEQTSRFPEALRPKRRKLAAGHLAEFYVLRADLGGDPNDQLEAERWRGVAGTNAQ